MPNSLNVSILQLELAWEDKAANKKNILDKINSLPQNAQLVILPEMFTTGFTMNPVPFAEAMDGETVQWLQELAATRKIIICGSIIIKEGQQYFNRLLWITPNKQVAYYNKRHLFAKAGEHLNYSQGNLRTITQANGFSCCLQICYDLRFPVFTRNTINAEGHALYDVLIYVANWPSTRIQHWIQLVQARAIENQCYVIAVNRVGVDGNELEYNGNSMIVDPMGGIVFQQAHKEVVFTYELQKQMLQETRTHLPFLKDADHYEIVL
jgi:omega-amidase